MEAKIVVTDCNFVGVQYDAKAVDAITMIAQGLVENAKALGALAYVLKASNVEVETLIKVGECEYGDATCMCKES